MARVPRGIGVPADGIELSDGRPDAIAELAHRAGFIHTNSLVLGGRHVAMLRKVEQ